MRSLLIVDRIKIMSAYGLFSWVTYNVLGVTFGGYVRVFQICGLDQLTNIIYTTTGAIAKACPERSEMICMNIISPRCTSRESGASAHQCRFFWCSFRSVMKISEEGYLHRLYDEGWQTAGRHLLAHGVNFELNTKWQAL